MRQQRSQRGGARRVGAVAALVGVAAAVGLWALMQGPADDALAQGECAKVVKTRDPLAGELEQRLADDVRPLLSKYCYECHSGEKKKGGVSLDGPGDIGSIMAMAEDWETVVEVINARLMPPEKKPQPTAHEILTIQQWVDEAADYYPADAEPDPGWYTIHRLNRSEYRNTLRDLLLIDPDEHDLAEHLPVDNSGYGFDNIADVLSMSPLQLEKFLDAAEQAVELAFGPEASDEPKPVRNLERSNIGDDLAGGGQVIWANGKVSGKYAFTHDGRYTIMVRARGDFAAGEGPDVTVKVGGKTLGKADITAKRGDEPQTLTFDAELKKGTHTVAVSFDNDAVIDGQDRNLYVDSITVTGPMRKGVDRGAYELVFFVQPTADDKGNRLPGAEGTRRLTESQAARQVLERFATRAFRRHADAGEVGALLRLYRAAREDGDDYESAVKLALTGALVSPNFLYRPIGNPRPDDRSFVYELDDYELASRLSYFLWSSMPDDQLLDAARAKKLSDPKELAKQARRMLIDPKADAFVENFAGQWLLLRKLEGVEVDPQRYPGFDDELRSAMFKEAQLFFADVLRNDRSVLEFLDSDRTFLNQTLAEHYGIDNVRGDNFRLFPLPEGSPRGGVLTMAATLTVTSEATRTSPVRRGDYVLSQLMGTAPPPPPPDVPPLEQAGEKLGENATLREQLNAHIADPNCAVCHKRLDPIGLAMENFDAVGAWRDTEQGRPIDASAQLPGGEAFTGPAGLKRMLMGQREQFVENLSRMMLTYAVGRGPEPFDRPTIKKIAGSVEKDDYRMQSLIEAVVLSDAFRKARGREQ